MLSPRAPTVPLGERLGRLRTRGRRLLCVESAATAAALALAYVVIIGFIDRYLHIPSVLRAAALVGLIVGAVVYGRHCWRRWRVLDDDLALALRIEEKNPFLNDALASAVQLSDAASIGSPELRSATRQRAARLAAACDFDAVFPGSAGRRWLAAAGVCGLLVAAAILADPGRARLAVLRLVDPFGGHSWPTDTQLTLHAPDRLARGDPFILRGELHGVVPPRVEFRWALADDAPALVALSVTETESGGEFGIRLEPNRVPRTFQFEVRANDACSPWRTVTVLRPPELTDLDGRASPQIHLEFPKYTGLPAVDLPDGGGLIDGIFGTRAHIRAATNRPIVQAELQLSDGAASRWLAAVAHLGLTDPLGTAASTAVAFAVAGSAPARLDPSAQRLELDVVPLVTGRHALLLTDADGLTGRCELEIRVHPDPSPSVNLELPAVGAESLSVLPTARVNVRARIDDPVFGMRSAWLEWDLETRNSRVDNQKPKIPIRRWGREEERSVTATVETVFDLGAIRRDDGQPLRDGDLVTLWVAADDHDDVSPGKPPGRSHAVELRIVSPAAMAALLQKAQSAIQRDLEQLAELQRAARELATSAGEERRRSDQLSPADRERLGQSAQKQQDVRQRLGQDRAGVRGAVESLRDMLQRDAGSSNSGLRRRADAVAEELDRLAREDLPAIEQLLSESVRNPPADSSTQAQNEQLKTEKRSSELERRQRDAERTLAALAERMRAWSDARELQAEAGLLERDLERLAAERDQLEAQPGVRGSLPGDLSPEQRAALERLADRQRALADRANEMTQKLEQQAAEKAQQRQAKSRDMKPAAPDAPARDRLRAEEQRADAERLDREADALARARDRAQGPPSVAAEMQEAARSMQANQHGDARARQQAATAALRAVQQALADSTETSADRLAKRLRDAEEAIDDLADQQERLQKKSKELEGQADDAARAELARDQAQLREQAEDLAQRLSRMEQERAARDLRRAAQAMGDAQRDMERGQSGADRHEDALERLDDAAQEIDDARRRLEDALEQERRVRIRERLQGFRTRHAAHSAETERVFDAARREALWTRSLQRSLLDIAVAERDLAAEVERFTSDAFADAPVVTHWLRDAARRLAQVESEVEAVRQGPLNLESWDGDRSRVRRPQDEAARRFDHLLQTMHESENPRSESRNPKSEQSKPDSAAGPRGNSDGVPTAVQWKLLRAMQTELNERTSRFAQQHQDATKWTDAERAEIAALQREQAELAALFEKLSAGSSPSEPRQERER